MSPRLHRLISALIPLGLAFLGAVLVIRGQPIGWVLIGLGLPLAAIGALAGDALSRNFFQIMRRRVHQLRLRLRPWHWWLILSVAFKIPVPLWPAGFSTLGLASTTTLFLAAFAYVWEKEKLKTALLLSVLAFGSGLSVELLGSHTGFPFGRYSYASAPAPLILGVPLIVPLGWFALPLATTLLARGRPMLAGLLVALWDIGLEPLMTAQHYWRWDDPQPLWADAPLQNFLGWWGMGAWLAWGFVRLAPRLFRAQPKTESLLRTFAVAYLTETCFLPGGLLLLGRPWEALVTLVAMTCGLWLSWKWGGRHT